MKFFIAFLCYLILDYVWAKYTLKVMDRHAVHAGLYAVAINMLAGGATIIYVDDPRALIATSAGAFIGTILATYKKVH